MTTTLDQFGSRHKVTGINRFCNVYNEIQSAGRIFISARLAE